MPYWLQNMVKLYEKLLYLYNSYKLNSLSSEKCIDCEENSHRVKGKFSQKCECEKGFKEDS